MRRVAGAPRLRQPWLKAAPWLLAIAAFLVSWGASAHPHHDEDEDEMKVHIARILREIGNPCANVVQVEETLSEYIVTCEIDLDGALSHAVYTVQKPD